ncbi:response regulator transcription factor [Microlunatus soli]|uniref:DNA-binding response regulator, NarL/FixJ family, contains REC and HTH domains n=1 Tax=Microlunatus soli TaxID=630515 RepID=A0A1H1NB91_9ACTN|nr:response regulator transcription factor [Microlunatus soli]SDR96223.1 DNA-binding response regulator, NarL/FixJ family, contains REC and HTH domains [Microlunatus soli]
MVIRVALVNDYEVVVHGLDTMLRSYRDTVAVVELDAGTTVGESVDIAMYDTFANPRGDREEIRRLTANPRVGKVAVYSWNLDPSLVTAALSSGASGYLSKALPAGELAAALTAVHDGVQVRPARAEGRTSAIVGGDWPGREEGLSAREAEVLALITRGLSNQQIADRAHLSINSVKTYIRSCYRRIGVSNRTHAVLWGIEHGFRPTRQPGSER